MLVSGYFGRLEKGALDGGHETKNMRYFFWWLSRLCTYGMLRRNPSTMCGVTGEFWDELEFSRSAQLRSVKDFSVEDMEFLCTLQTIRSMGVMRVHAWRK